MGSGIPGCNPDLGLLRAIALPREPNSTQAYANRYGSRIEPSDNAMAVTQEARAQQGMPLR